MKKNKNKEVFEQEIEDNQKEQTNEAKTNNQEIESLKKELETIKKEKESLLKEIATQRKQIDDLNKVYIIKMKEKTEEVQKILNNKQNELTALNETKLEEFKTKLYTKDILDLIETIEQFEKIINIPNENPQIQNFLFGFKMFSNMFSNSLANMSIEKININLGDEPNYEIVEVVETTKGTNKESGTISEIISNGYKYKDKVIKFAKVKVEQ